MSRPMPAPMKRYLQRLAVSMALYMLTLFAAVHFVGKHIVTGPVAFLLAIVAAPAAADLLYNAVVRDSLADHSGDAWSFRVASS